MKSFSRRSFLKTTGGAWAASNLAARTVAAAPGKTRVRHAVIGTGNQGRRHCQVFGGFTDLCEVAAICDVDPARREKAAGVLTSPDRVLQVEDYRRILEDPTIDSVSVATPDHWHTPVALAALQAGKHVYVEKPCCHNIHEGKVLAEVAAKTGRCVQHGTQSRSGKGIQDAVQFLREGGLGKVRMAKAINHQFREPIGREPESDPPPGVNYDLWLGPAPVHRFTRNRWHYNWHWFWDYGTGDIGNDGIHQVDVARWGLGAGLPNAISATGGQLFYEDDHQTPDTQIVTYEYDDCYLLYEMRLWTDYPLEGHDNGVVFYGDKGRLDIGRDGCIVSPVGGEPKLLGGGSDFDGNLRNFLESVLAEDPSKLNAPISEGAPSAMLCHLGNIATRVGRSLRFDPATCEILGDAEASGFLSRSYRSGYELPKVG